MIENTNIKQFYPGPILNNTLEITDFLFNDAEQIKIKHSKLNEEGILVDVDLNYPTDYEVTKVLPSDINAAEAALTAATGQIMLKNVKVLAGEKLTVYRVSLIIQDKDYPRTGAFPAATHEGALDYLTMQNQEQKDEIDRALKVPISTQNFEGSLPLPIPSRALKINNDGTGFEMSEFDPDLALVITEEFKNQAQQAAIDALSSQTAAANSETVAIQQSQNATTQAANAKASADNAAELNQQLTTNYNTYSTNLTNAKNEGISALTNASNALRQTQITNCLLEVPQNIKLELVDNVLTLKAGSKVIVPNGFEDDGTTLKFDEVVFESDMSLTATPSSADTLSSYFLVYDSDRIKIWGNQRISTCTSGTTAPTESTGYFYNTSTNILDFNSKGVVENRRYSFPIGVYSLDADKNITTYQAFNGMGYIGSTIWVDKGVKGLIPNGRNADGTLKNNEFTTSKVLTRTFPNTDNLECVMGLRSNAIGRLSTNIYQYDFLNNYNMNNSGGQSIAWDQNIVGSFKTVNGQITSFQPKLPFRAVDWNDAVLKDDLSEVVVITETYVNETSGYRIWSDGYCEQWGIYMTGTSATITFLKPFKDTNYIITMSNTQRTNTNSDTGGWGDNFVGFSNYTTTSFRVSKSSSQHFEWKASGYIA